MGKFTNLANLDKLAKALNNRCKNLIDEEKARAIAEEQLLQTEINITKDMFGGKSIKYITQAEYDNLSEAEKNSDTVTYFITDAVDLSHEHENKEFLDNLAARNISIGNKSQVFDGVNDLHYSISDIGAAPAVHNHDDRYYTETEINTKISEINDNIDGHVADLNAAIDGKADTGHNHDDRYYTETEVTNKLAGKADTGHTHDDRYYTESEIDGKITTINNAINGKAPSTHTHDDRYYTETEINGKIEDINETINTNVSTLNTAIATAKSGAISESKSYTDTAISKLVDSAPEAMNTLNELAKAIGDHQTEYEAYVATVSANIATAKAEAIAEAAKKDTALHTTISAEIDADVKVEKERAMDAENALQNAINGKANASHGNHVPATQTADNTKFLRNDNTWATVTPGNIGAAPASHGNHVPATQTASNKVFLRNDNTWATVTPGNIGAAPASHTHDDRYYTETEINGKIEDINETINGHVADLEAAINGKAPASHNHDDRYYTESEMNTKLAGKSDTNHTHDDKYYTETEIDGKITTINNAINSKAPSTHTHDDRYYTETEIDGKIEDINENIDGKVAEITGSLEVLNGTKLDTNVAITNFIQSSLSQEGESYDSHMLYKGEKIISPFVNTNTVLDDAGTTLTDHLSYFSNTIDNLLYSLGDSSKLLTDAKNDIVSCINELQTEINNLDTELDTKVEDINETINNKEAALQSSITNLTNNKADLSYVNGKLEVVNAIKLNGYSIWVGTTAELEAIETRDPNTLYFEIGDETGEEVVQVDIVNGTLQLTADKYQKTNMLDGTEILFPSVNKFTEIHLYFAAGSNMNINLPDNCKWRVEPNIEEGNSYEIVATYNTIEWLVNVIVYS